MLIMCDNTRLRQEHLHSVDITGLVRCEQHAFALPLVELPGLSIMPTCVIVCGCAGTELYPRIGRHFDIKTWTNCRMGMMSWTFIVISFAFKQLELTGRVSNAMLISVVLQGARSALEQMSGHCISAGCLPQCMDGCTWQVMGARGEQTCCS